jgi:hypothetical protein
VIARLEHALQHDALASDAGGDPTGEAFTVLTAPISAIIQSNFGRELFYDARRFKPPCRGFDLT